MGRGPLSRGQARDQGLGESVLCHLHPSPIQVWTPDFRLGPWASPGQALPALRLGESFDAQHLGSLDQLREKSIRKAPALSSHTCVATVTVSCPDGPRRPLALSDWA